MKLTVCYNYISRSMVKGVFIVPVIGLVGPFGSGCSFVSNIIHDRHKYTQLSLSTILRSLFTRAYPDAEDTREALQDYGNDLRAENHPEYLAEIAWRKIERDSAKNYVIDSIRNPHEVDLFRRKCPDFYLIGVFADRNTRFERTKTKYGGNRTLFDRDDERDSGERFDYGQRVTDTFCGADIVLLNDTPVIKGNENYKNLLLKISDKIGIIERKLNFRPKPIETNMAIAYASSMRSSCLKRKVGAVIVGGRGGVCSSGYNEVPLAQKTCLQEYAGCYRKKLKQDFLNSLSMCDLNNTQKDCVYKRFAEQFKILDYCRALHAEESAILNLTRYGTSLALDGAELYTTTYPCNLCANKIVQVGIRRIVYFEPYPMEEAKKILAANKVEQIPFEGITYNAYFKLMEVVY